MSCRIPQSAITVRMMLVMVGAKSGLGCRKGHALCEGRVTALPGTLSEDQVETQQWVINRKRNKEWGEKEAWHGALWHGWSPQWGHVQLLAWSSATPAPHVSSEDVSSPLRRTVAPEHLFLIWAMSHVVNRKLLIQWSCFWSVAKRLA